MMGYPRALAARYEIARAVSAWPSAEPTAEPVALAWRVRRPRLTRDLSACHRAPPSRVTYPRGLATPLPRDLSARGLAAGTIPACQRYPRDIPPNPTAWPSRDTDTPSGCLARRIPARRYRAGVPCGHASDRRTTRADTAETGQPNQTLGNPTLIEHSFELAEPNRTPVRTNKCSNLHPANLGKVTRITGNRFHSPERFKMLGGSFQSRTLLAGLKVESNTRSIAHLFDGSRG